MSTGVKLVAVSEDVSFKGCVAEGGGLVAAVGGIMVQAGPCACQKAGDSEQPASSVACIIESPRMWSSKPTTTPDNFFEFPPYVLML